MDNCDEDKPPSLPDSEGSRSPVRDSRVDSCDLYRIPIWRGGNLPGMALYWNIGSDSIRKHKVVDLVFGEDDQTWKA